MSGLNISKLAERLAQLNSGGKQQTSSLSFLSIKDGRNVVRILPGKGESDFATEVWVHYGVGKSEQNKNGTMVVCPTTKGENQSCPVCELSKQLRSLSKKKDDNYDKQSKQLYRKKRVYFNAISREEDLSNYEFVEDKWKNKESGDEESPVKVLGTGIGIYKDILSLIVDPEYGDITDPVKGLDLIITKSGSGQFNTEYDVKTVRKESAIGFDGWESALNDLSQLAKVKTYDEIAAIISGTKDEADDEDEEDEDEVVTAPKSTAKEESSDEDDEDLQREIRAAIESRRKK